MMHTTANCDWHMSCHWLHAVADTHRNCVDFTQLVQHMHKKWRQHNITSLLLISFSCLNVARVEYYMVLFHFTVLRLVKFYILLTVHLGTIRVNNQLDALFYCVYFTSLHISSNSVLIIRRNNCINTSSGIYHSV